ncbi:nitrate reductase [Shewanella insulae]|uniref:nitrate reductase n=1 Tax=Shewanella insulae TaxID=2681496 RepID=UPI001EFC5078|nr:nitrate reductase [Shewanella insulae]MCG9755321.1 nitrate reductase [Shewanella insulae]
MSQNPITPWIKTTCAYCGVGCGVEAKPQRNGALLIRGDKSHPANLGKLCSKGQALGETLSDTHRLKFPMIENQRVSWDKAISTVAEQFQQTIAKHGPDSVAFYLSGQLLTEDYYVANKLMKGFIGSANVDTNSRLCMSSSVAGHKRAFGSDSMPGCYQDIEATDLIILVGSNLAWCHPILFQRIKAAKAQNPDCKLVVIDPRKTASCYDADLHLALANGKDVLLFNRLLTYLADNQLLDHDYIEQHTQGFEATLHSAQQDKLTLEQTAKQLQISPVQLKQFFELFGHSDKVLTLYSQGVNQSTQGTDKVNSIINCHLATGKIGQPGSSPFSITGQPNAMGGREVGGLANMLASHLDFSNHNCELVRDFWRAPHIATRPGLKATDMFDAIAEGKIKAIWIMATNPAVSLPDSHKIKAALAQCPFVVVSDCVADTDTLALADVKLPAQGWSEKSGTVTNSERRISRQRRVTTTPGEAKPDWWIISEVAKKMGFSHGFNYRHEAQIFREYATLTNKAHGLSQNALVLGDLADISDSDYYQLAPQQWPVNRLQSQMFHQRLFADGRFNTDNLRARLIPVRYIASAQTCDQQFPLKLNSGRSRDQWHTMTRTALAARLCQHQPEPQLQIHPEDAAAYRLDQHDIAEITSATGKALLRVNVGKEVKPGEPFSTIHWSNNNSSAGKISTLGKAFIDPISGQPEMKATPVSIRRYSPQSQALLVCRQPLARLESPYWVKQTIKGGFCYFIASELSPGLLNKSLKALSPYQQITQVMAESSQQQCYRLAQSSQQQVQFAYIVSGQLDPSHHAWFAALFNDQDELSTLLSSLLSTEPKGTLAEGRIICACKQVGEKTLTCAIKQQEVKDTATLTTLTEAGSGCGSCIAELEELIKAVYE